MRRRTGSAMCIVGATAWLAVFPALGAGGPPVAQSSSPLGMKVGGERDGPSVQVAAPWQEPPAVLPEARLPSVLSGVVDSERGVMEDAANRELPAPARAEAKPAEVRPATPPPRRGRGRKDEPPPPNLMQHDVR